MRKYGKHTRWAHSPSHRIILVVVGIILAAVGYIAFSIHTRNQRLTLSNMVSSFSAVKSIDTSSAANSSHTLSGQAANQAKSANASNQMAQTVQPTQADAKSMDVQQKVSQLISDNGQKTDVDDCADAMASAVDEYNHEVATQKDDLDTRFKFPVPISISTGYVQLYNDAITDLFNQYVTAAANQHCSWPLKSPATLPLNYPKS